MEAALYGGAVAVFVAAALFYFHGWFRIASLFGIAFWLLAGRVLTLTLAPGWAWGLLVPLAIAPAGFLFVHALDARGGFFRLPTIYSIPIAFLTGAVLLLCAGLGVLLS